MAQDSDRDLVIEQTRRKLLVAKRLLQAKKAHDSLIDFSRFITPDPEDIENAEKSLYQVAPHHKMIAEALERVERGGCLRLMISLPPQHGKSQLSSRNFPAWAIGRKPFRNIMLGTYNQDFANEFGDDVRTIVESSEYKQVFPNAGLKAGSRAKDHMTTTRRGKLSFLGRGGAGTGRPADLFIIDDPIKDAKEAESLTIRNDVWQWFTKVAYTRCHSLSAIIIIQTRWHEDDLIGRLSDPTNQHYDQEEAGKWLYVNVPALFEQGDEKIAAALGRKLGESLWPERFSVEHLQSARRLNPNGFSALYQGRPTPPEGAFFKNSQIVGYRSMAELPRVGRHYLSGDLALSVEKDRDYSCVGVWLLDELDDLWLLPDLYWEQKAADESVDEIIARVKRYKPFDGFWEKGQIAKAVGPFLEKKMREDGVWMNITPFPASGTKGDRCISIRGRMAQGRVHFPFFAPWWTRAKDQLLKFTGSGDDKEDDFCDMLGLIGQGMGDQIKPKAKKQEASNVVQIGSIAWVRHQHDAEKRHEKQRKIMQGF